MKSASSSLSTSSVIALLRSSASTLHFCCKGLHSGLTLRQCCMIFLSIPNISSCLQAKISWFALKKEIIFSFSTVRSVVPIFNTLDESHGWSQLLVVFLTVWEWALVHWSPMCGSRQMLRQLDSTFLPELGLLWFLLPHGLWKFHFQVICWHCYS